MLPSTKIASGFTIADYALLRDKLDVTQPNSEEWAQIRGVFRRRIDERFLRPVDHLIAIVPSEGWAPGFAILALDCLLIDTLQAFRTGRTATGIESSAHAFTEFLGRPRFSEFTKRDRRDFVNDVRNGLLHNGETRGDWVVRVGRKAMLERTSEGRIFDRTRFHREIVNEFEEYVEEIRTGSGEVRERFLARLDSLCGRSAQGDRLYFAYGSSLLNDEIVRTVSSPSQVGPAYLPGWRITFTKHSTTRASDAANIEEHPSSIVWGFVYRIPPKDWSRLIQREGGYTEREVLVLHADDVNDCSTVVPMKVRTFIAASACVKGCGPAESYVRLIVDGAIEKGLPSRYIEDLKRAYQLA